MYPSNIGFVVSSGDKPFYLATQVSCVIIRSETKSKKTMHVMQ
jgi:hypothetical protein